MSVYTPSCPQPPVSPPLTSPALCDHRHFLTTVELAVPRLLDLSCDAYGNFVVQALLRRAHDEGHTNAVGSLLEVLSENPGILHTNRYGTKVYTFCNARFPVAATWAKKD